MPLDVAAYRKDTAHLAAAEHGAYLLLIMHYWATGGVPDDDRQLARIAAMTPSEWKRARAVVQAFFHDGWKHNRIDKELARAADISSKRSASAKLRHSNSSANAQQKDTHAGARPGALPPQPHTPEQKVSTPRKRAARAEALPADWQLSGPGLAYAMSKGWPEAKITSEAERFKNHAESNGRLFAGVRGIEAAWRNWVTSPFQQPARNLATTMQPRPGSREDTRERTAHAYNELGRYADTHADDEGGGGGAAQTDVGRLPFIEPA